MIRYSFVMILCFFVFSACKKNQILHNTHPEPSSEGPAELNFSTDKVVQFGSQNPLDSMVSAYLLNTQQCGKGLERQALTSLFELLDYYALSDSTQVAYENFNSKGLGLAGMSPEIADLITRKPRFMLPWIELNAINSPSKKVKTEGELALLKKSVLSNVSKLNDISTVYFRDPDFGFVPSTMFSGDALQRGISIRQSELLANEIVKGFEGAGYVNLVIEESGKLPDDFQNQLQAFKDSGKKGPLVIGVISKIPGNVPHAMLAVIPPERDRILFYESNGTPYEFYRTNLFAGDSFDRFGTKCMNVFPGIEGIDSVLTGKGAQYRGTCVTHATYFMLQTLKGKTPDEMADWFAKRAPTLVDQSPEARRLWEQERETYGPQYLEEMQSEIREFLESRPVQVGSVRNAIPLAHLRQELTSLPDESLENFFRVSGDASYYTDFEKFVQKQIDLFSRFKYFDDYQEFFAISQGMLIEQTLNSQEDWGSSVDLARAKETIIKNDFEEVREFLAAQKLTLPEEVSSKKDFMQKFSYFFMYDERVLFSILLLNNLDHLSVRELLSPKMGDEETFLKIKKILRTYGIPSEAELMPDFSGTRSITLNSDGTLTFNLDERAFGERLSRAGLNARLRVQPELRTRFRIVPPAATIETPVPQSEEKRVQASPTPEPERVMPEPDKVPPPEVSNNAPQGSKLAKLKLLLPLAGSLVLVSGAVAASLLSKQPKKSDSLELASSPVNTNECIRTQALMLDQWLAGHINAVMVAKKFKEAMSPGSKKN